jgi:protein-S-isoprenylcysteine O-methyltransferase Ste14
MENQNKSYDHNYKKLRNAVIVRFSLFAVIIGILLFIPAGSIGYWQAWVYCGVLFIPIIGVCAYFLKKNPALLERRLGMKEKERSQKLFAKLSLTVFLIAWVLPGLDYRFKWSSVQFAVVIVADFTVLCGYILCFFTFKENEYASRIIEVEKGQKVISTGPYASIRHPLYLAGIIIYLLSPLALGSWWGFLAALPLPALLVFRILKEEELLKKELPGYEEYMRKVKYRLIPFVW